MHLSVFTLFLAIVLAEDSADIDKPVHEANIPIPHAVEAVP